MEVIFNETELTELINALLFEKEREFTEQNIRERVGAIKDQLARPAEERPTTEVQTRQMSEVSMLNSYAVMKIIREIKQIKIDIREVKDDPTRTGTPGQKRQMRISESKGAASLKMFTGDKKEFNEWLEKLINQFTIIYPGTRPIFKELIKEVNASRKVMEASDVDLKFTNDQSRTFGSELVESINDDMHFILTDKTTGEARIKIENGDPSKGVHSLLKLIHWYSTTSGEAVQERIRVIMHPPTPKKDEEIFMTVENWIKEIRQIEEHGSEYHLPPMFKITALRMIMAHKMDRFDVIERQLREEKDMNVKFDKMVEEIREYASELRLQKIRHPTAMAIDEAAQMASQAQGEQEDWGDVDQGEEYWEEGSWPIEEEDWSWSGEYSDQTMNIDAMAKGKAKGKGKNQWSYWSGKGKAKGKGQWSSGQWSRPKGKGKSKGKDQWWSYPKGKGKGPQEAKGGQGWITHDDRQCYNCQGWGHIAINCPQAPKGKGKGKGINEVQSEFPGPEQLMTLGGTVAEVTKDMNLEEFMMPARSAHDMRPNCSCCRRPRSNRAKSIKRLAMKAALKIENRFKVLEEKEDITEDDEINVQKVNFEEKKMKDNEKFKKEKNILIITKDQEHIDQVQEDDQWERIIMKIDSGAIDTCIPPDVGRRFKLEESQMSKARSHYRAANGTQIKNHGKRAITAFNDQWTPLKVEAQVADVSTPLASVFQMCSSGNTVMFNGQGGKGINDKTGRIIPIELKNGAYEISLWVPASKDRGKEVRQAEEPSRIMSNNEINMDFIRHG